MLLLMCVEQKKRLLFLFFGDFSVESEIVILMAAIWNWCHIFLLKCKAVQAQFLFSFVVKYD